MNVTLSVSAFPNVPNARGVPQLARSLLFPVALAPSLGAQAPTGTLFQATQAAPVWGVFDKSGKRVIDHDSMRSFGYRAGWALSDFPIQAGGFASYDKVTRPFENVVTLVKGGTASERTQFLNQCDTVGQSLDLFQIFTPERHYVSVNCARQELTRRDTDGAFFLEIDLYFQEIRQVTAQYSSTALLTQNPSTPDAAAVTNGGTAQAVTPTAQAIAGAKAAVMNGHGASASY